MRLRKETFWIVSLMLSALCCSVSSLAFCSDEERYGDYYKEANEKWADYLNDTSRMECSLVITTSYPPKPESKGELTIVFDYPYFAVERKENGVIKYVSCLGEDYGFKLNRNPETDSLEIFSLRKDKLDASPLDWKESFFSPSFLHNDWLVKGAQIRYYLGQEFILWGFVVLPQLLQHEDFSIESLSSDAEKIYVDYKLEPKDPFNSIPVRSGSFVLFRDSYLVESAKFLLVLKGEEFPYSLNCEYESVDGNSILKKKTVVAEITNGESLAAHKTIFEYNDIKREKQPSSRFRLSYYGLPEP